MLQEHTPDSPTIGQGQNGIEVTPPTDDGKPHAYDLALVAQLIEPADVARINAYQNETSHRELAAHPLPEQAAMKYRPILHLLINNSNTYHDEPEIAQQVNNDRVAKLLMGETKTIGDNAEFKQQLREALRARRTIGALALRHGIDLDPQD